MSRLLDTRGRWVALAALALACGCGGSSPATTPPVSGTITPNTSGWWRDKVFYEVFVRSFADSDGDGIGDLNGLTAHLDYLNDGDPATTTDLGVDALWLMPIFKSPSDHGYDVTDYRSINPQYGTLADFDALIAAAHHRGIRVVLDMVLNHSSSQHPWFQASKQGASNEKRDWYVWRSDNPGWTQPWGGSQQVWYSLGGSYYYAVFWSQMPDLNLANPAVEAELVATMKYWLARGVDGFRLDAVRYYLESADGGQADQPATHAFLRRIRLALQTDYPGALLVAEAWSSAQSQASYYGRGDEVQLAFSFEQADAILSSIRAGASAGLESSLSVSGSVFADRGYEAPFLSNHDQIRVQRALGGDSAAAHLAAATLMALPGTPFLYYGEELGMQGGAGSADQQKRTPFNWTPAKGHGFTTAAQSWFPGYDEVQGQDVESERADSTSLWSTYRKLISLRHAQPALLGGEVTLPAIDGCGAGCLALLRSAAGKRILFIANFSTAPSGPFAVDVTGIASTLLAEGLSGLPVTTAGKLAVPGLAARSYAFFALN